MALPIDPTKSDLFKNRIMVIVVVCVIAALLILAAIFPLNVVEFSTAVTGSSDSIPIKAEFPTVASGDTMEYTYNSPESDNDIRYSYQWEILKTALDCTCDKFGPYKMTKAKFMSEKRQYFELKNHTSEITVMYLGTVPEFEQNLLPVRIPVDKNLGGYCVMLIRKEDQPLFDKVKDINDLKKISIGQGYGWIDVDILRSSGFNVKTGSNYEGLFKMLANKRFDAFSRSAVEVLDEYNNRKDELSDLKIEDSILLYYPLPMYFWFSRTEQGEALSKRVRIGMETMIESGVYDEIFMKYHGYKAKALNLKKRRIFRIENPFLVPETPFEDKRLWFDPIKMLQ